MSDYTSDDDSYHGGSDAEGESVSIRNKSHVDLDSSKTEKGGDSPMLAKKVLVMDEALVDIPDMAKATMSELLLSVQNLGTFSKNGEFVRGEDCIYWLGDIQLVLAKDDLDVRHVHTVLCSLNVLSNKLIPLIKLSNDDDALILSMLKIFTLLTTPMTPTVVSDASVYINPKTMSATDRVIKEKKKKVAMKQLDNLLLNKESFIDGELVSIIVGWLNSILDKPGSRSDIDGLNIEVVLTFVRNCLAMDGVALTSSKRMSEVHDRLVKVFHEQHMLEIILLFLQDIDSRDNKMLNIILMEIVYHMTQSLDPEVVATAYVRKSEGVVAKRVGGGPSLKQLAQMGRSSLPITTRHTHFGGAVKVAGSGGRSHIATSVNTVNHRDQPAAKFQRRKVAFNSSQRSKACQTRHIATDTDIVVANFCRSFLTDSFKGFMKSVKTEFRIESMRLNTQDKIVFFRLTRFFLALHRHVHRLNVDKGSGNIVEETEDVAAAEVVEVSLMSAMDLYSFSLVHRSIEEYIAEKKWPGLEYAAELLMEMTAFLLHLRTASTALGGGLKRISLNLMGNLYFGNDPTEKLGKLLRSWQPATFSKTHLGNMASLSYYTFKLLDHRLKKDDIASDKEVDILLKLGDDFDMFAYVKKLATSEVVSLFRLLLESYQTNSHDVTHHAQAFLQRLSSTPLEAEAGSAAGQVSSFEPMMYNVPFLSLCQKVLNDRHLKSSTQKVHVNLRSFCASIVRHFTKLASSNHVLFVDALFQQPALQRVKFCQSAFNHYVNPDMVHQLNAPEMNEETPLEPIATFMKDDLLNQSSEKRKGDSDDDEEYDEGGGEDEFDVDAEVTAAPKKKLKVAKQTTKRYPTWSQEEDDLLSELYAKFKGTRAVVELIGEELAETYKSRDAATIRSRLVSLNLATRKDLVSGEIESDVGAAADDEDEMEDETEATVVEEQEETSNIKETRDIEQSEAPSDTTVETSKPKQAIVEKLPVLKKRRLKKKANKKEDVMSDSDELVDSD